MVKVSVPDPKKDKLRQLILYISRKSEGDAPFGSVKLNKLLFFADMTAYRQLGRPITDAEYQKLDHGPCPRRIKPLLAEMTAENELTVVERKFHGKQQKRPMSLIEEDLSAFNADEVKIVDEVLEQFWGLTATAISEQSHDELGWKLANIGETIPMHVSLIGSPISATESQISWAQDYDSTAEELLRENH